VIEVNQNLDLSYCKKIKILEVSCLRPLYVFVISLINCLGPEHFSGSLYTSQVRQSVLRHNKPLLDAVQQGLLIEVYASHCNRSSMSHDLMIQQGIIENKALIPAIFKP
jgi:hypothetical protein